MMKSVCIFVCALAAVSAHGYNSAPVGGYAYQVQPALTVKAILPSYGGYNRGAYGAGYEPVAVPLPAAYGNNAYGERAYGRAPAVDRQAIALAKLALAAPSAGGPLVWKEPRQYVQPAYEPRAYAPQLSYGRAQEAQGASAAAASSSVSGQKKGYRKSAY